MTVLSTLQTAKMNALSTMQDYMQPLVEQINGSQILQEIYKHKWSILGGSVVLYVVHQYASRPSNLPPGPIGYPIIGSFTEISEDFHINCLKMSKKYKSDIISFYVGKRLHVILNSADAVKAGFVKTDDFSNRNPDLKKSFDSYEMLFTESYSEEWRKMKTFMMSSLKTHGFGTFKSEENMKLQLTRLINHLQSQSDNTILDRDDLGELIKKAGACVIMKILVNEDYDYDDKELEELLKLARDFFNTFFWIFLFDFMPGFVEAIMRWPAARSCKAANERYRKFFQVLMEQHKDSLDPQNPRDFMDDVLIMNSKTPIWNELQIVDTVMFLTPDAIDTTGNQMGWPLFYLCWFQEAQKKMVQEIKEVCGDDTPGLKDRTRLSYCEAVIWESLRISALATVSGPHFNLEDVYLNGYFIPKYTRVQANIYAVHNDERTFPGPEKFKPERFISKDGKLTGVENLMPFNVGRRKCVGESLARSQIFYYVTGLVQKFELSFSEDGKPTTIETDNIFRKPPKHKMKFTPRY